MRLLALFAFAISLSTACVSATNEGASSKVPATSPERPVPIHHMPPPTENWLADDSEMTNKQRRKQWMKDRHLAAPDFDWKAVERANGERQRIKRNALSKMAVGLANPWTERGSRNQAGRMHVAALAPDGLSLYAGSSKGGVWKGDLNGSNWTPIGDNLYGGAHWLAVVSGDLPADPPVVLAATDGGTVSVTRDDGVTWNQPLGFPSVVSSCRRAFVTSDGTETIFLVLRTNNAGSLRYQLWRSIDKAVSFQVVKGMNTFAGDAWGPRNGAGPIFVINATGTHRSDDNGTNWVSLSALPSSATSCELAASEAGAPRLYGIYDMSGGEELWRSDDAGLTWSYMHDVSDYWGSMTASIVDPDLMAWGGVEVWRTTNGGNNFSKVNNWYDYYNNVANKLHADIPGMDVLPIGPNGESWFVSTDGGLFSSSNGLNTVQNISLNGLRVSQYYTTLTSTTNNDHIVAGAQDQGWQRASQPPVASGLINFTQDISGDYGHAVSGDGSHKYVYTTYPGFILLQVGENNPSLYQENFPANEINAWLPPLTADPDFIGRFYFLGSQIWQYRLVGGSNDWVKTVYSTQDFEQSSGEYLTGMVFSPVDVNRAYAVTSRGRLWYSNDRGITWTQSSSTGPGPQYFYGTAIAASSTDIDTVWVGGSGYGSPAVWRSTNGGVTYQPFSTGLPSTLVYGLAESPDLNGTLFCGTETSAYRRDLGSSMWVDITGNDAPVTTYWCVEAVEGQGVMRFGTYGRGIWDYSLEAECGYSPFGLALDGANTLLLDNGSGTQIGTAHQFVTSGATPSSVGILAFSPFDAFVPFLGGTSLLSAQNFLYWLQASNGFGVATRTLNIPNDQSLVGVPIHFQSLFPDPQQPDEWAFSNGLRGVICE
ncbi:MAG: photosystem II stability/assembly factor-like uncharacterized protein [Planctomycetota bacterium]|jgi:photosystem II stability/assembly factor-like uncharacterized protein